MDILVNIWYIKKNDYIIDQQLHFVNVQSLSDSDIRLQYPGHRILDHKPRAAYSGSCYCS